jgi:hypothetical protein
MLGEWWYPQRPSDYMRTAAVTRSTRRAGPELEATARAKPCLVQPDSSGLPTMMEPDKSPTEGLFPANYQPTRSHSLWASAPGASPAGAAPAEVGPRRPSQPPPSTSHRRKLSLNLNPGSFNLGSSQPSPGDGSMNPFATIRSKQQVRARTGRDGPDLTT